jgi:carbonic anhydrase/acetyltransferase-like protein (isoleucine patch superfamily)
VLHTDPGLELVVGSGVTVGHKVMLHGCTIGDNSLVGIGSTVLNGAKIGNNCIVGAHALVTEDKTFADGSLILGAPARVVRELDAGEIEMIRTSADIYVENAARFSSDLLARV